jgi:type IV pilus assembly protein PilC
MRYEYRAIDRAGAAHQGSIEASSRQDAIQAVKSMGLYVVSLTEKQPNLWERASNVWIGKPVKSKEFVVFCRQLAVLLEAGTSITQSLTLLSKHTESKPFQQVLERIVTEISAGSTFSEACSRYPKIFPKIFVYMIRAGEVGGHLDEIMRRIATHYERESQIREKSKSAMTYPLIVSIVAVLAIVFLLTKVIPQFVTSLEQSGSEIPWPTRIVLAASSFLVTYWFVFVLIAMVAVIGWILIKQNPAVRYQLDKLALRLPIFGVVAQKSAISRMARTLSTLLASSVPVLQSISIVAEVVGNEVMARSLHASKESLRRGETMSGPLQDSEVFPPLVSHMIRVGEETGRLESMLEKIAEFYEEDVIQATARLNAVIEPMLLLMLALIVGTIVLSVMLPMFQIYQNV